MKYTDKTVGIVSSWVRENGLVDCGGASRKDLCVFLKISLKTLENWLKKPEFFEAVEEAKQDFRATVEKKIVQSLARAAIGYDYEQVSEKTVKGVIVEVTKKNMHVTPNVGAGIFLLTNIAPERWKNRQNKEVSGGVEVKGLNVEVIDEGAKQALKEIAEE